ncbi:hypothetical protein AB0H73_27560 [Streptomyces olivoreticuli]|uniref:hypothetical protein n=1 Tax=Streptomyces olivoreticuli TaxID=68246 RepID=UPI000E27E8EA|nr:hypothetical protein [Streptomyces olivoreticuli]
MRDPARTTPRRTRPTALCALLFATALATGCSGSGDEGASAATHTDPPVQVCAKLISYWAGEDLTGGHWAGLDWEQKGLSNDQYVIYDDIVRAARAEQRQHGTTAARKLIEHQAQQRCAAADGATHSSENWRPPA